jgi:hypothetical protein
MTRIKRWWLGLPLSVRKAVTDFWTVFAGGASLILSATIWNLLAGSMPSTHDAWIAWAGTLLASLANVAVNAARRAWETDLT